MSKLINKSYERLRKVAVFALCVVLAGSFYSCENRSDVSDTRGHAAGTIIGRFSHGGIGSLLVRVDEKYPIGKTIKYEYAPYGCLQLPKTGWKTRNRTFFFSYR